MPDVPHQSNGPLDWLVIKDPEAGGRFQDITHLMLVRTDTAEHAIETVAEQFGTGVYFALELGEAKIVRLEVTDA